MTGLDRSQTPKTRPMPHKRTALVASLDIGTSKIACMIARLKPCPPSEALRGRGWLQPGDELRLTEWGAAQRKAIEDGTDTLAAAPYDALGDDRCTELRALVRSWSTEFAQLFR